MAECPVTRAIATDSTLHCLSPWYKPPPELRRKYTAIMVSAIADNKPVSQ